MGISTLCVSSARDDFKCLFTFPQTNVLVGDDGRALIGGLGMAFMPSAVQTRDRDRSFWGAPAPELIEPWRWGLPDARPTPASDVFSFAAVALEVRMKHVIIDGEPLNRMGIFSGSRRRTTIFSRNRCCGNAFNVEWHQAEAGRPPQTL